jgi:tetratricopeptide (TPR) repeat protein
MTLFQLLLFFVTATIFYLFFKQLFSGNYPKRGVDFETDLPPEQVGGITDPGKIFTKPLISPSRIDELLEIADKAAAENDWLEVKKAMQSAMILDEKNVDVLRRLGMSYLQIDDYASAKDIYKKLLEIDPKDDLVEASLANALHKLGEDDTAIVHHERSLVLDADYAPHYYNYANTLYDLNRKDEALELYKKALEKDPDLKAAHKIIKELEND